jgi:hypothetical protein
MPKNKTKTVNLEDYILKQDANLRQLAKDVREGLKVILPDKAYDEHLSTNENDIRTEATHISYLHLLEDMQALRSHDVKYVPESTVISFEPREEDFGIYFSLDNSKIITVNANMCTPKQISKLYKVLEPYIIKKSEAQISYLGKSELPKPAGSHLGESELPLPPGSKLGKESL